MPSYIESLVQRIRDRDEWPDFDRPYFLDELNGLADDAFATKTLHGYLAALLIYHQLTEEMLRLLLQYSEFFVQLELAPIEIHFPVPEKAMFGRVLDAMRAAMEFENKSELVSLAQEINKERIDLVHSLTKQESVEAIAHKVGKAKARFEAFYSKFVDTQDWFLLSFKDLRKDRDWDEILSEE